ncbi:methyltransferase domain-containing protein [Azospirillum brasilense]|uniref:class I SAM-dependent methyltransferase n=1 Tax=Azospirillum brasilense TaxID=192 RepID=UPI00190BF8FC|nr:class I SAM-dependent methyltransferase [Azospirillum brasilense]MBK3732726.1 methyltransferase domain-containing protein [Azospirillum brasilense]
MARIDFIQSLHSSTRRNYVQRVVEHDKAECAEVARRFDRDYWDGERRFGYGGYRYDGRWRPVAERIAAHYGLKAGDRLLDIGCGKGFLLYEFTQVVPGIEVAGIDVSEYGIANAKEEIRPFLQVGDCRSLPYPEGSFDAVISLGTFHNLPIEGVFQALSEMQRVGRGDRKYFMVESFRDEREKANLLYWQLTCLSFHSPESWAWIADGAGYTGDHGFIFFD